MFQKVNFISRSTRASFSLILLQRATTLSYNELIFSSHAHSVFSQAGLFKASPVPFQSMIDSITELSKAFPHYIPLTQGQSPDYWKRLGNKALQDEDCMLTNQLLFSFILASKPCLQIKGLPWIFCKLRSIRLIWNTLTQSMKADNSRNHGGVLGSLSYIHSQVPWSISWV